MAYNPYFRYNTNNLNLRTGMRAPNFPVNSGLGLHTNITDKLSYTTTTRMHGTTGFTYIIKGVKKDFSDKKTLLELDALMSNDNSDEE